MAFINLTLAGLIIVGPILLVIVHQSGWLTDQWAKIHSSGDRRRRL
jgi:hypothetical protein